MANTGNTTDFDKLRKRRRRIQLLKRLAILTAFLVVIVGILSLNNLLLGIGFVGRINDFFSNLGGEGYPIAVPGGVLRDTKALEGELAVLNDTNLYIYSTKGKELLNVQRMSESTVLLTAGSRALTYEVGGTKYRLHNRSSTLHEAENDHPLTGAALGARGDYAIISSSKQYTAQVTVFDPKFEQVFQWSSNELVTFVALHPKGGRMAAGYVGAQGGELLSSVSLFAFDTPNETARLELTGELILHLEYLDETHIGILTDKSYHVMDSTGKELSVTGFGGERLVAMRLSENGDVLLLTQSSETRSQTLILLDKTGKEQGRTHPSLTVRDMQAGQKNVYLLNDGGITVYDLSLAASADVDLAGASRIQAVKDKLYYFTAEEIQILEHKNPRGEQESSGEAPATRGVAEPSASE